MSTPRAGARPEWGGDGGGRSRPTVLLVHHFALPSISGLTVTVAELQRLIPEVDPGTSAPAMSYEGFPEPAQLRAALEDHHGDATCVVGLNLHIEVGWGHTVALAEWCMQSGRPLLLHVHDYWPHHRDNVAALTERFGARLLAITPAIVADLAADGFCAALVPAGVAVPPAPAPAGPPAPPRPWTVGAVGRLVGRKRFADVVGAFCAAGLGPRAALHLRVPPSLVFPAAQDRERLEEIRAEVRAGGGAPAVTVEVQPRAGTEYRLWAACVSASEYEGVSMTPLEALLEGCPVLLSDIPPHRRIAEAIFPGRHDDVLFPVGDRRALAHLLGDELGTGRRRAEVGERREEIHGIIEQGWSLRTTARTFARLARPDRAEGAEAAARG